MLLLAAAGVLGANEPKLPSMPAAVSSNAVASLKNGLELFSLMGVGPKKAWDDITNQVYIMHLASGKWSEGRPVPGVAGRLGASAAGVKAVIILLGGYVVDGQGGEMTVADVNLYSPLDRRWYSGKEIPIPVDSAVVGVFRDRYVYLIGGRSNKLLVNNVQVYDEEKKEKVILDYFPDASDELIYYHEVFNKEYKGARTEDKDGNNPDKKPKYDEYKPIHRRDRAPHAALPHWLRHEERHDQQIRQR